MTVEDGNLKFALVYIETSSQKKKGGGGDEKPAIVVCNCTSSYLED